MQVEIVPCATGVDDWRVEAIDFDNEGIVYVTCFSGLDAKERAEEYAAWKYAPVTRELAGAVPR
jgi:hypothetical protein